jgi:hypothetical protein
MRCTNLIPSMLLLAGVLVGAETRPLTVADFPDLPVTTGYLANSLMRGGGVRWDLFNPKSTYLQLYTEDMVASPDGTLFCTTTWEEGHLAAGMYRDGDALPDSPPFATTSGRSVAASDTWLVYGHLGELRQFQRHPVKGYEAATGGSVRIHPEKDAPWISGVVIEGDTALAVAGGKLYTIDLAKRVVVGEPVPFPDVSRLRMDRRGNLWGLIEATPPGYRSLALTVSGNGEAGKPAADALKDEGDNVHWLDKSGKAELLIDLGGEQRAALLRFHGAGWDTDLKGLVISGATSAEGPWTDLITFTNPAGWWPETVQTLDERPWKFLRLTSTKAVGLRALQIQVREPEKMGAVLCLDRTGRELARLPDITHPIGMNYDAKADRILVFNNDPDQQIHAFTGLDKTPKRDQAWMKGGRFGVKGGLSAAKGQFGPARFDIARGLALDAAGNLAVFCVGPTGFSQSRLECYAPDGTRKWEMKGLAFLDAAEPDPGDPNVAYSALTRYERDPKGRDGDGWRAVGTTVDRFANPEDSRVRDNHGHVMGVRRIAGKPILFVTTQYSDPMSVYRFDANGIAVPCAYFNTLGKGGDFPPNRPAGFAWGLWQDANGDGRHQMDEWRLGEQLAMHYLTVAQSGDVWMVDARSKGIRHFGVASQLDSHGSPTWPTDRERLLSVPNSAFPDLGQIRGLEVSPDGKTLFAFGFTPELPNVLGKNHPLGRLLVRFDISSGSLVETHRTIIPYDTEVTPQAPKDQAYVSAIAGEFLFLGYEHHQDTLILRQLDLTPVGRLPIGPQSQCPIYDGPSELIVQQVGTKYELFMSMYVGNSTTHLTWDPAATTRLTTPTIPTNERKDGSVTLKWGATANATAWQIERRSLLPDGWGPWEAKGTVKTATWTDAKAPAAAGYRIRAEGAKSAHSDWSATVWMR